MTDSFQETSQEKVNSTALQENGEHGTTHDLEWKQNKNKKKVYMQFSDSHETGQEHVRPIITKNEKRKKN